MGAMVPSPSMTEPGRKRAVEEAADQLRRDILIGRYRPGDHLPGERELSAQLGVSRLTLRSAIARLESQGLIRAVHGAGNLVLDFKESGGIDLIGYLAGLAMENRAVPLTFLGELFEMRRIIAAEVIALATERATDAELRALRTIVDQMAEAVGQTRRFMELDLAFARGIARATKNFAFVLTFNTVQRVIEQNPALELAYAANAEQTTQVYARLAELMVERNATRARQVTERLLDRLDRRTLELIARLTGGVAR